MARNRSKIVLSLFFTIGLLFVSQYLYARAGGGSSSGGSLWLKLILLPFILIYVAIKKQNIAQKKRESSQVLALAAQEDPIWNENNLKSHTQQIFFKMQQAWMDRNLVYVKNLISKELYDNYKVQLDFMKTNHEKNMMESIEIKGITIISTEDYKDNSRDAFVAYVEGKMIDYSINELTGKIIKNKKQESAYFADTYHFTRSGNDWILNNISNKVSISDIKQSVNIKEG